MTDHYTKHRKTFIIIAEASGFTYNQKREWLIYGANAKFCPSCRVGPGYACLSLSSGAGYKIVRWPHEDRIDYDRLFSGLELRGYCDKLQVEKYLGEL